MDIKTKEIFIFDLEGTLYDNKKVATDGAIDFLNLLIKQNKKIFLLSNTTSYSPEEIYSILKQLGFTAQISVKSIYTGLFSLYFYIKEKLVNPFLIVDDKVKNYLVSAIKDPLLPYDSVVIGNAKNGSSYERLNIALNILLKPDAKLISCSQAIKYSIGNNQFQLDGGAYTMILEKASQKKAIILGKPSKEFFLKPFKDFNLQPSKAVMIGDDLQNDIIGAYQAGLDTILVKTGKASLLKEEETQPHTQSIGRIVESLKILVDELN